MLFLGANRFIGSTIQDKLIELGHDVAVLDNFRSGKQENLNSQSKLYEVSVLDKDSLEKAFMEYKPETVFHLAAQNEVPYSMEHPFEDEELNVRGMMNLMEACRIAEVKKVIYSNTGGAFYGEVEEKDLPIEEDTPIKKPTSFYGVSKGSAESYLKLYGNLHGIKWVSLRYSNVYGPRQDGNKEAGIVAIFTKKMLAGETPTINGNGTHSRDYVFVEDVVEANLKAIEHNQNDYFNIATQHEITNNQVFETIESILQSGMKPTYGPERPGDPFRNSLSNKKAKEILDWEPKVDFKSGVSKTLEYYQK